MADDPVIHKENDEYFVLAYHQPQELAAVLRGDVIKAFQDPFEPAVTYEIDKLEPLVYDASDKNYATQLGATVHKLSR